MSSSRVAIPMKGSALDDFARRMILKNLTAAINETASPKLFDENASSKTTHSDVLIDDDFIASLPRVALEQISPEDLERIRGRTARSMTLSMCGTKVEMTLEF